jgi:formamidopyrimidine-DNA glycosylase
MPELPELEIVREVLERRLAARIIVRVTIDAKGGPLVVRDLSGRGFAAGLVGEHIQAFDRRGKYLLFHLAPSHLWLVANPKLTGRFQLCAPGEKKAGPVHVTLHFENPAEELRYVDQKKMGQLYLTPDLGRVPLFAEMGPEALSVTHEEFASRLKSFRGEIKGILVRADFLAGIGNAYADEILWAARLHTYRKRTSLTPDEVRALYEAMREVLCTSIEKVRQEMGDAVHLKPRDFFAVHMRGGEICPRCGTTISTVTAHQRITNFCRTCQPGGLIRGM